MKPELEKLVAETLALYEAGLAPDGVITTAKGATGVRVKEQGARLRFVNAKCGTLYMSGPKNANAVKSFVEKFWYWEQKC